MVEVRKLNLDDLEQIISLRISIQKYDFNVMKQKDSVFDEKKLIQETKKYLIENLNKKIYIFGLFIDDELISNCGFYIDNHFPAFNNYNGTIGYICNVFTKEEYRHKGYQKKVFDYCLSYAKKLGITSFKLSSINEKAIKMYEAFGFKKNNTTYSLRIN